MDIQEQFYHFYKPYLKKIYNTIINGKGLILVGINAIGKNLLTEQVLSPQFKEEFIPKKKVHLIMLDFKDKYSPHSEQLYKYWLKKTADAVGEKLDRDELYNDFSFYLLMSEMIKKSDQDAKICFILLDAQQILNQSEQFFKSLIYLHKYSYGKVSYIFLSEPQILEIDNPWIHRFIQRFTNYKFIFLKTFDSKTTFTDIKQEEKLQNYNFKEYYSLILKHSKGLHGASRIFCHALMANPHVRNIRQLKKIIYNDKLCQLWVREVIDSLPRESIRILREVSSDKNKFKKYGKNIYGKWLVDLGFLKKNGKLGFPLMLPILNQYTIISSREISELKLIKNLFYANGEKVKLSKKELLVLKALYKWKGKIVTYDQIGRILWETSEEKFSLWAISQLISRIRNKLSLYYVNPNIIHSQRGEGYLLT